MGYLQRKKIYVYPFILYISQRFLSFLCRFSIIQDIVIQDAELKKPSGQKAKKKNNPVDTENYLGFLSFIHYFVCDDVVR